MRKLVLTESAPAELAISPAEASAIRGVAQRLSGSQSWWGASEDQDEVGATAISLQRSENGYVVHAREVVGLVAVPGLEVVIRPKVPLAHFVHLLSLADGLPRHLASHGSTSESPEFWELVVRWYLESAESLVRRGLNRGYQGHRETLTVVRGRVDLPRTLINVGSGRVAFPCEYDEFTYDIPHNRVLLHAARLISGAPALPMPLRRRALILAGQFEGVGGMRHEDLRAPISREIRSYTAPLGFARSVIESVGRIPDAGDQAAWSFLLRTPEPFESAILAVVARALAPLGLSTTKQGRKAQGAPLRFTPDLVVDDGSAVGDVKYRFLTGSWDRGVVYQALAFARVFQADRAVVVGLSATGERPPSFRVDGLELASLAWRVDLDPQEAELQLVRGLVDWASALKISANRTERNGPG